MVNPKKWGRNAWYMMHTLGYTCDVKYIHLYREFFNTLKYFLPCGKCRKHYAEYIKKTPLKKVKTQQHMINWSHNAHNRVNKFLKKKKYTLAQVNRLYKGRINESRIKTDFFFVKNNCE